MQRRRLQNSGRIIDMKHYTVEITNEALADMDQLYNHIAYVLQAPENAMDQKAGYLPVYRNISCLMFHIFFFNFIF